MNPLDIANHLFNFCLPAVVTALGCMAGAWLLRLRNGPPWTLQFGVNVATGLLALVAGLIWFGRDGKMATYAVMVLLCGTSQWWMSARRSP